jgi:ribonuclease-3
VVAGERYGGSEGRSKKQAEQRAAAAAWRTLSERQASANGKAADTSPKAGAVVTEAGAVVTEAAAVVTEVDAVTAAEAGDKDGEKTPDGAV